MKKLFTAIGLTLLTLLTLLSVWQEGKQTLFVAKEQFIPFASSMANCPLKHSHRSLSKRFARKSKWKKIRKLYDLHILHAKPSGKRRIPKIIHHIAPADSPQIEAWSKLHPAYETIIWTPEKIATLKFLNQARYEKAKTPEEKDEILRFEILYSYGGIIAPPQSTPMRSFDALLHLCDLFVGLRPLETNTLSPRISSELIAATPHHPILKTCLTTPFTLTRAFLKQPKNPTHKNVALPSSFFFPNPQKKAPKEAFITHQDLTLERPQSSPPESTSSQE